MQQTLLNTIATVVATIAIAAVAIARTDVPMVVVAGTPSDGDLLGQGCSPSPSEDTNAADAVSKAES